jgi:RND family efflux transporter MFP subunit
MEPQAPPPQPADRTHRDGGAAPERAPGARYRAEPGDQHTAEKDGNGQSVASEHGEREEVPQDLPHFSKGKLLITLGVVIAVFVVAFLSRWIPDRIHEARLSEEAQAAADAPPIVDVVHPTPLPADEDLILFASVSPMQQTSLYARVDGYLKRWMFDINSHVEQGQLLAEISAPDTDAQLNEARAMLEQAKANVVNAQSNLDLANSTYQRYHGLLATGSVTQQDLDTRQSNASQAAAAKAAADAAVKSAQATVERLEAEQGFEKIVAPFSGTITLRPYDVGARITASDTTPGHELFDIAETDKLRVWVYVPQNDVTHMQIGQPVWLEVPRNYPGERFNGIVARWAGVLDPNTRTMLTELDFDNADGRLWAGMYATVHITIHRGHPVLTVPTPAMLFEPSGTLVAVASDNKVHFKKVKVGQDLGTRLEILDGLSDNDLVVTNPGEKLEEGGDVQIAPNKDLKPAVAQGLDGQPSSAGPTTRLAHASSP